MPEGVFVTRKPRGRASAPNTPELKPLPCEVVPPLLDSALSHGHEEQRPGVMVHNPYGDVGRPLPGPDCAVPSHPLPPPLTYVAPLTVHNPYGLAGQQFGTPVGAAPAASPGLVHDPYGSPGLPLGTPIEARSHPPRPPPPAAPLTGAAGGLPGLPSLTLDGPPRTHNPYGAPATKLGTTIEFPPPPQPPPPPPPPLPLRFDDVARLFDWGRRRLLGTGSFAHVYAATCVAGVAYGPSGPGHVLQEGCLEAGDTYAVKVLPKSSLNHTDPSDYNARNHLVQEIAILQYINHPNCIRLHDAFQDVQGDSVYLVLAYMEGAELFNMLRAQAAQGRGLSEKDVVLIANQILDALWYLHSLQIVHRDLKPENVIINPETMAIKIIDFGFAKFFGQSSYRGPGSDLLESPVAMTPLGTVFYMAPEVLRVIDEFGSNPVISARDDVQKMDIFAVGVFVYVLLRGDYPFRAESAQEFTRLIKAGPDFRVRQFDHVSPEAKDFCRKLMSYQSRRRPTARAALQHPWLWQASHSAEPTVHLQVPGASPHLFNWLHDQERRKDQLLQARRTSLPMEGTERPVSRIASWERAGIARGPAAEGDLRAMAAFDTAKDAADRRRTSGVSEASLTELLSADPSGLRAKRGVLRHVHLDPRSVKAALPYSTFGGSDDSITTPEVADAPPVPDLPAAPCTPLLPTLWRTSVAAGPLDTESP